MNLPNRYALWDGNPLDRPHGRLEFSGKSSRWCNTDTEENYYSNVVPNNLSRYRPESFEYVHNESGYRCDSFDFDSNDPRHKNILFIGDSFTYGVGIPQEEIWAYRVLEAFRKRLPQYRFRYLNVGRGGRSLDYCVRMAYVFSKHMRIHKIVILAPHPARTELMMTGYGPHDYIPNFISDETNDKAREQLINWKAFADNPYFMAYNQNRNFALLESLCVSLKASFLVGSWINMTHWRSLLEKRFHRYLFPTHFVCDPPTPGQYARDGFHPPGQRHLEYANDLLDYPPLWENL